MNFVRKHALKRSAETGCDLETAALRVFSNAEGAYGANVGMLIDAGAWTDEDEISIHSRGGNASPTAERGSRRRSRSFCTAC